MKKILDYIMDEWCYNEPDVGGLLCSYAYDYLLYIDSLKDAEEKTSDRCRYVKMYYGLMCGKFLWI